MVIIQVFNMDNLEYVKIYYLLKFRSALIFLYLIIISQSTAVELQRQKLKNQ